MTPDNIFSWQSFTLLVLATYILSVLIFKWLDSKWRGAFEVSVLVTVLLTFFVYSWLFEEIEKLTSTEIVLYNPPLPSLSSSELGCDPLLKPEEGKQIDFELMFECGEKFKKAELEHEVFLKQNDPNYRLPGERTLRVWKNDPRTKTHMILNDNAFE